MLNKKVSLLLLLVGISTSICWGNSKPMKSHIVKGNKEIFYYGSVHSNDVNDPMFSDIEESFVTFKPDIVLIEGGYNMVEFKERKDAMLRGEMAFVSYLSSLANVKKDNAEPSDSSINSILIGKYSMEKIFTMYILRQTFQLINQAKNCKIDLEKEIVSYANKELATRLFEDSSSLSFGDITRIVEKESGILLTSTNIMDKEVEIRRHLYKKGSETSKIHAEAVALRDAHTVRLAAKYLKDYNRIFIIMGNQHLMNQEDPLKKEVYKY